MQLFDTADVYSRWVEVTTAALAKQSSAIGLFNAVRREELIIATKVRGQMGDSPLNQGLSRQHIMAAAEASFTPPSDRLH